MKNTKSNFLVFLISALFLGINFTACNSDCTDCTLNEETLEICLDGEISYTDIDGNVLPDNEVISYWESQGFECDK